MSQPYMTTYYGVTRISHFDHLHTPPPSETTSPAISVPALRSHSNPASPSSASETGGEDWVALTSGSGTGGRRPRALRLMKARRAAGSASEAGSSGCWHQSPDERDTCGRGARLGKRRHPGEQVSPASLPCRTCPSPHPMGGVSAEPRGAFPEPSHALPLRAAFQYQQGPSRTSTLSMVSNVSADSAIGLASDIEHNQAVCLRCQSCRWACACENRDSDHMLIQSRSLSMRRSRSYNPERTGPVFPTQSPRIFAYRILQDFPSSKFQMVNADAACSSPSTNPTRQPSFCDDGHPSVAVKEEATQSCHHSRPAGRPELNILDALEEVEAHSKEKGKSGPYSWSKFTTDHPAVEEDGARPSSDPSWLSEGERSFVQTPRPDDPEELLARDRDPLWTAAKRALIEQLLPDLLDALDLRPWAPSDASDMSRGPSTQSTSNPRSNSFVGGTRATSSVSGSHKRGAGDDGDDPAEEGRVAKRAKVGKKTRARGPNRLLACPYCKFDPVRYSEQNMNEQNYRHCATVFIDQLFRLKQHLYRVHTRPEFCCPTCFEDFEGEYAPAALEAHVRARTCTPTDDPWPEKMTAQQQRLIKRRHPGRDVEDCWYDIWDILFPGSPRPPSIYADQMVDSVDRIVHHFNTHALHRFQTVMRENPRFQVLDPQSATLLQDALPDFVRVALNIIRQVSSQPAEPLHDQPTPNSFLQLPSTESEPRTPSTTSQLLSPVASRPQRTPSGSGRQRRDTTVGSATSHHHGGNPNVANATGGFLGPANSDPASQRNVFDEMFDGYVPETDMAQLGNQFPVLAQPSTAMQYNNPPFHYLYLPTDPSQPHLRLTPATRRPRAPPDDNTPDPNEPNWNPEDFQ